MKSVKQASKILSSSKHSQGVTKKMSGEEWYKKFELEIMGYLDGTFSGDISQILEIARKVSNER